MPPKRFTHLLSRYCKTAKNINMWVYVSKYHTLTHTHTLTFQLLSLPMFFPFLSIPTWTGMSLYEQIATKSCLQKLKNGVFFSCPMILQSKNLFWYWFRILKPVFPSKELLARYHLCLNAFMAHRLDLTLALLMPPAAELRLQRW